MAFSHGPYTFDGQADGDAAAFDWTDQTGTTTALQNANTAGRWCHDTNATSSSNVGPDHGAGGDPDGYAYTEMSSQAIGDIWYVTFGTALDASANDITFDFKWCARGDDAEPLIQLETSENGGTWTQRGSDMGFGDVTIPGTSGVTTWWQESIDLAGLISHASTEIRIKITCNGATFWHNDIGFDEIEITGDTLITDPVITDVGTDEDIYIGQTNVIITGTTFEADGANSRVRINSASNGLGTDQVQVDTSWSDTSINFTVSLGSLSYGTNYVFVRNQTGDENAVGFQINLRQDIVITGLSDTTVYDGQTGVEVNGSGFGATQVDGLISITSGATETQTVTSWTDTKITFTVNQGLMDLGVGLLFVVRDNPALGDLNPNFESTSITLVAAPAFPTISSIDGDNAIIFGQTGVIVLGTNFESPQGTGRVDICASATYGSPVLQTETSWGTGSITLTTVQGALSAGINYLFVENDSGLRNAVGFAFTCAEPASPDGLFIEASIQTVITSAGLTTTAFMVKDE